MNTYTPHLKNVIYEHTYTADTLTLCISFSTAAVVGFLNQVISVNEGIQQVILQIGVISGKLQRNLPLLLQLLDESAFGKTATANSMPPYIRSDACCSYIFNQKMEGGGDSG